jgi:thymidine kinase
MASGKTTALHRAQQMAEMNSNHKVYSISCSNNEVNVSRGYVLARSGGVYSASFTDVLTLELAQRIIDEKYTDVFIDEGQFFDTTGPRELKDFCDVLLAARLDVSVAALNSDLRGDPWPAITHLFASSPKTKMCAGWCSTPGCGIDACYTHRLGENTERVGVHDTYISLCRNCWIKVKTIYSVA